ncbi:MAG: hypothetical protein JWM74_6182 [Myxococcaceae bacterium]|nr:hypothetical protein [Myxococcaceae bacterium]
MRTPLLLLSSLLVLAACDDKKPLADTTAASATTSPAIASAAPSASVAPTASASAQPSASAGASASAAASAAPSGKPSFGCKTKVGDAKVDVEAFDVPKGAPIATVKVEGKTPRSFTATTQPHAATYTLVFSGYGAGDKHPAAEPAYIAGTTVLGRLVANGDKMEFYADKGFPTHPAKDGPYVCEK